MISTAILSQCKKYRYELIRIWQPKKEHCCFIMLNPSTADSHIDDPTIRRCMGFAESWGFGGFTVGNLFAFRATNPADLLRAEDPIGPENDSYLRSLSSEAAITVCAWGNHGIYKGRWKEVLSMLCSPRCLGMTGQGQPKHPLYLKKDLIPMEYPR